MDMEFGKASLEIAILVNGRRTTNACSHISSKTNINLDSFKINI